MAITVNDKDLGMVTAYAYALAGGYTGTEAEFEALLGKIAEDLAEIENLSVQVQTLPAGSDATASYAEGVLTLGIPRGDKGETGDQGEIGPTPQLSVGTVTTGAPGTEAEVEITGTPEAPVLNFTLPRGDTGNITQAVRYDAAQTLTDAQKEQARANIDAADAGEVADLRSDLAIIEEYQLTRLRLTFDPGSIDKDTGVDNANTGVRSREYVDRSTVLRFAVNAHTGALYVYNYDFDADAQAYVYLGRNQRTSTGNYTSWLKGLSGTHFRVTVQENGSKPNEWLVIGINNTLIKKLDDALEGANNAENVRYWRHTYAVAAGEKHSATPGEVPVSIPSGYKFAIKEATNVDMNRQFFVYYSDGTSERLYSYIATGNMVERNIIINAKAKDITSISVYINNTANIDEKMTFEVFVDNSLGAYTGYPYQTQYYIENDDDTRTYFEKGRARSLVQTIAVVNNQVWEFAQGKAYYNGVEYDLANGHGNNCNWGVTLHGDYPYLYCPTWTLDEMNINVFSFDGTAFTLVDTIHYNGYTGYLNAYVDEQAGFIYAFIFADNSAGKCHYLVSDLTGTVLMEKDLPYLIRTIQGLCMHHGIIYAVSGYGNTASPNYLHKISPDGTLLGKYVMGAIGSLGEIEGIDFLDNQMVLATYYYFYINPQKGHNALRAGYTRQLELSE